MADFAGMGYPIVTNPKGYFPVTKGVDLIKGDLLCLLLTNPGERVMMPQFGTPSGSSSSSRMILFWLSGHVR